VDLSQSDRQQVAVTVRNFRETPQRHRIELKLPAGLKAEPPVLEGTIDRKSRQTYSVQLTVDRNTVAPGVQIVPFDITLDGKRYGELFDFLFRANAKESP
jgi:uncharacterized heparinase superfamily protein